MYVVFHFCSFSYFSLLFFNFYHGHRRHIISERGVNVTELLMLIAPTNKINQTNSSKVRKITSGMKFMAS